MSADGLNASEGRRGGRVGSMRGAASGFSPSPHSVSKVVDREPLYLLTVVGVLMGKYDDRNDSVGTRIDLSSCSYSSGTMVACGEVGNLGR